MGAGVPLNYRRERYVWVPREAVGPLQGADFELRGFVTYLAKFCDARSGQVTLGEREPFRALTLLCAVHPEERRAFVELVRRLQTHHGVKLTTGMLQIPALPGWQRTREPARRLYAQEPAGFAKLPAFSRFAAAELIRTADDTGRAWVGTVESLARHYGEVAVSHRRHEARKLARLRLLDAFRALVVEGFLQPGAGLDIKNFALAQRVGPDPDASLTEPARLPDGSPTEPAPLPDGSPTGRARLPDGRMRVSVRNFTGGRARNGPLPTLPSPPLPYQNASGLAPAVLQEGQAVIPGVEDAAKRPRRARRPPPPTTTLPFAVSDALGAIEAGAGGRFIAGDAEHWTPNQRLRIEGHIRRFPALDQWRALGAWLAAGGDAWRKELGPGWAASDALADGMVRALAGQRPASAPPASRQRPASAPPAPREQVEYLDPLGAP